MPACADRFFRQEQKGKLEDTVDAEYLIAANRKRQAASMVKGRISSFFSELLKAVKNDWLILSLTVVFYAVVWLLFQSKGLAFNHNIYLNILSHLFYCSLAFVLIWHFVAMIKNKTESPLRETVRLIADLVNHFDRIFRFLLSVFVVVVTLTAFTNLKSTLGYTFPFVYDVDCHRLDKLIHFGSLPWELTHAVFSSVYATGAINLIYNLWFFVMWFTLLYFVMGSAEIRNRFLLGFVLCWILVGGVVAITFPAAGPCYIANLDPANNFYADLFARLHEQDATLTGSSLPGVWALGMQEGLWQEHAMSKIGIGSGISAMPSMHVSIAVFLALSVFSVNKRVGIAFLLFATSTLIGSVHLGWHYAVDGYVSIVLTFLIWKFVDLYYKRSEKIASLDLT